MAQDSSLRREAAPASSGHGNDPLAELARLIGQNDPFAEGSNKAAPSASRATPRPQAAAPQEAPEWLSRPSAPGGQADYYSQAPQSGYQDPNDQYQQYQDDPRYQDPQYDQAGYQGAYAGEGGTDPAYGYQEEAYYDDQQQGYDESGYDSPPAEKRRGGLMTVLAVVALAVVGTAAAFGYRAWTGPSTTTGEPPVIKAEQTPTKVVPATPNGDAQLNKQVYDRVGDRGGERMVPREEQPIDPRSAARPPSAAQTGVLPPLGAAPAPIAAGDPKPVKTVTIRPDQAGAAAAQPQVARPPVAGAPPPAPTRVPTTSIQSAPAPAPAPRAQSAAVGSNFVQVSSQLSESDAQASFRMLQSKYPGQLGDQRVVIQKADLTAHGKGVVYRAMVGPFASREEAAQLCTSLKNAGGQCVLHSTQ